MDRQARADALRAEMEAQISELRAHMERRIAAVERAEESTHDDSLALARRMCGGSGTADGIQNQLSTARSTSLYEDSDRGGPSPRDRWKRGVTLALLRTMAKQREAPANWHQFCAFALSGKRTKERSSSGSFADAIAHSGSTSGVDEDYEQTAEEQSQELEDEKVDKELRSWGKWLFAVAWVMVFMQCGVAAAVVSGTGTRSCLFNSDCAIKGTYCRASDVTSQRCGYCGADTPFNIQFDDAGNSYNEPYDSRYIDFNMTTVRRLCMRPTDQKVSSKTWYGFEDSLEFQPEVGLLLPGPSS